MDAETAAIITAAGPRLRRLRHDRSLTLADLSSKTGLSVSTLSRLETGHRNPALDVLLPLARAYEVSLDHLVGGPVTADPRVHLRPRRLLAGGIAVPLTREPSGVQAFKHVLEERDPEIVTHEGHAWIHVLAGRLRLILDGTEHEIDPGEHVEFDATTPHWFGPAGDDPVEILHLFSPDGRGPTARDVRTAANGEAVRQDPSSDRRSSAD